MDQFHQLGIPQPLLHSLERMKFQTPTPIQIKAIPFALEGRDILGSAQTGTGKTAAFAIPLIAHLMKNPKSAAIVMTPTRELAAQVLKAVEEMLPRELRINTALLIGGMSMAMQLKQLRTRPRIIIGTPGRINDHLSQGSVRLDETDFLVLDETDRMLDMGFEVQIDKIVSRLARKRQTLLFSATLPPYIVKMSEKYLKTPERVAVGSIHAPVEKIKQELFHLRTDEKYGKLLEQLNLRDGSIIVFVKTKRGADRLAKKLNAEHQKSEAIHGNLSQSKRNRVIQDFRGKKFRVMVATDVAARGLDIPHIEHVINYDLPQVAEDYIHRIGRTARAGAEGAAACFITPEDRGLWAEIHRLLHPGEKAEHAPSSPRKPASFKSKGRGGAGIPPKGKKSFFARQRKQGRKERS